MTMIKIESGFYIYAAILLLLFPLRLVFAWLIAVAVHELSHYLILRLCGVDVLTIRIRNIGIEMDTTPMTLWQEFICALAGPVGGLLLLIPARYMPCTAICAFIQSVFNLIPIFPLDGGRALRCVLCRMFGANKGTQISKWIGCFGLIVIIICILYLAFTLDVYFLPIIITVLTVFKVLAVKFPCKERKQIVQ